MADFKISRIRFKWRGSWLTGTAYTKDDIVQYAGKSYVCLIGHTASVDFNTDLEYVNNATIPPTSSPKWELWVDGYDWRSTWQTATLYNLGDLVRYGSTVYRCVDSHTSQTILEQDQAKWTVYSSADEWKYNWAPATRYKLNDVVKYRGIVYKCNIGHISAANNALGLENDQSKWDIVSRSDSWQDEWLTDFRYRENDVVRYGGNVFICVSNHTSSPLESAGLESQIIPNYTNLAAAWTAAVAGTTSDPLYNFLTETLESGFQRGDLNHSGSITASDTALLSDFLNGINLTSDAYRRFYKNVVLEIIQDHPTYSNYVTTAWKTLYYQVEHKFNWVTSTRYKINDVVKYGASLWRCIVPHTSATFETDFEYWEIYLGGLEFDNQWSAVTEYQFGDVVRYGGYSYVFISDQPSTNKIPSIDTAFWNLLTTNYSLQGDWSVTTNYRTGDIVRYGGFTYIAIASNTGYTPPNVTYWETVVSGRQFRGKWVTGTVYRVGDVISYASSSYIALLDHTAASGNTPTASLATTWDYYVQGDLNNPLQEQGDLLVRGSAAAERFAIGVAGESLLSTGTGLDWRNFNERTAVYYVSPTGVDIPSNGKTLNTPWKTLRYACYQLLKREDEVVSVGSFILYETYKIVSLGTTDWNAIAGTTGVTYVVGNRIVARNAGSGSGTARLSAGPADIYLKTGVYNEVLPIIVPAGVAIIGDELRETVVQPAGSVVALADVPYSLAALTRLQNIISSVITNAAVTKTPSNPLSQNVSLSAGSGDAGTAAANLFGNAKAYIDFYVNTLGSAPSSTGSNTATIDGGRINAVAILEANKEFLVEEAIAFIGTTYPAYSYNQDLCRTDVRTYIDAIKYDLTFVGNYRTLVAARWYAHSVTGSTTKDMFYVRSATGIRNMTIQGLAGTLGPQNQYLTRRPTAGAYVSLDPGWGPADTEVWITTKSPYVQNVTTFGTGCVGLKIDGGLHNGGNDSVVANDFTQVLSDGIGVWCTNLARTELVSVFSYYGHIGYLAENGGKIRATNGNSSYGTYGVVSEGVDTGEVAITGNVDNRNQQAQIASVFAGQASDQILIVEYSNCGQNYSSAAISFAGAGTGAAASMSTFRNSSIYEARIIDPADSGNAGGSSYVNVRNQAQDGDSTTITLASNDQNTQSIYLGMRIIITSGTGVGQYGYCSAYDNITKIMTVRKESDDSLGWDHVVLGTLIEGTLDTSTSYSIEPRVIFSAPGGGGIRARGRAIVAAGRISEVRIWEPGSNYTSATVTFVDPNNSSECQIQCRIGNGVLGQPTFSNRGNGYQTSTTTATITGNGFADIFQIGRFLTVKNISLVPGPGANLEISGINNVVYRVVTIQNLGGNKLKLRISPELDRYESPADSVSITIRENYSQCRVTGHDFLDIGTGNFAQTNYPNVNEFTKQPENEVHEAGGGRVFYTSTDQDGNFRAGEFFAVEQATGTVTISADFFALSGLEELSIGGIGIGGSAVIIREFSTDNTFSADSNNIVPTQRAIKGFISRRISGGGADAQTGILIAGVTRIGPQQISNTVGQQVIVNKKVNIRKGIDGSMLAMTYFSEAFSGSDLSDDYYNA